VATSQETTLPVLRHSVPRHDRDNRGDVPFVTPDALVIGNVSVIHLASDTCIEAAACKPARRRRGGAAEP
jgi:hypothetical protein